MFIVIRIKKLSGIDIKKEIEVENIVSTIYEKYKTHELKIYHLMGLL